MPAHEKKTECATSSVGDLGVSVDDRSIRVHSRDSPIGNVSRLLHPVSVRTRKRSRPRSVIKETATVMLSGFWEELSHRPKISTYDSALRPRIRALKILFLSD